MKAIIEFDLPEDQEEFNWAIQGPCARFALQDIIRILRSEIKYTEDSSKADYLDKFRDKIFAEVDKLPDLMD